MAELDERELLLLFVEDLSDFGMVVLDVRGGVLTWNAGAEAILGYAAHEIVGRHFSEFYTPQDKANSKPADMLKDAGTWGRHEAEGRLIDHNGVEFEARTILRPVRDAVNRVIGFGMVVVELDRAGHAATDGADPPTAAALPGHAKILVVDDDELVRTHVLDELTRLGYRTVAASNGREAIELLARTPDIDLLFTDVVMPGGMSGREVAEAAKRVKPDLKVLYASGYNEGALKDDGKLDADATLVKKPFLMPELTRKLHKVLGTTA